MRTLGHPKKVLAVHGTPQPDELRPARIVVPFGSNGGGEWTGHPIGVVIVLGITLLALIGLPEARLFLLFALPIGGILGYLFWRRHLRKLFQQEILPFGQFGKGPLNVRLVGLALPFAILLIGLLGTPLIRLFLLVAVPIGVIVGLALWLHREEPPRLFSRKS